MKSTVWVVTYYDMGKDPTVTVFDNKEAALKCYKWFMDSDYDRVSVDECPIYNKFIIKDADNSRSE